MPTLATRQSPEFLNFNPRERASNVLKAMGNPHRLKILCHLSRGEASVSALEDVTGLSQSALSQHLARLRQEGLVKTRRHAQTIYYSLYGNVAMQVLKALRDAKLI
ncbi:metalloregulator ArsR/SmtB family transcription factor [Thalassospiraceae bacterium LMO-JJ14]|nr:metalloregulator ArsR/SmtB family transcription factor [Thalassospiraceae bacterium LMO-JJ14]